MDAILTGSGENRMKDQDLCVAIGEDLNRQYPGYFWMVGVEHGSIRVDLQVPRPIGTQTYGFRLNASTAEGQGGRKKVMWAGGELLERFGLRRGVAHPDTDEIAREHGLITDNNKNKSKY